MATDVPQGAFKTAVTEKLTLANLQRLDRRNTLATLGAAVLITLCLFWMLFHLGGDASTRYFSDIVYVVAAWLGGILACATAYRMHRGHLRLETSHQLAWLLVGLAMFFDGLGGAYYASLDVLGQVIPTPSFNIPGPGRRLFRRCPIFPPRLLWLACICSLLQRRNKVGCRSLHSARSWHGDWCIPSCLLP